MERSTQGVWRWETAENLHGYYYLYTICHEGQWKTCGDPYARACGRDSRRCMAVDLRQTDPAGWQTDHAPAKPSEDVIYELHIKEFSWQAEGGFPPEYRGKYLAFTCPDTTLNGDGVHPTGLAYLRALGVTHVQLMPTFDYGSVPDEAPNAFNWGYDPLYYNIPEGSYSTDPRRGEVRIRECKAMVQSLHRQGFRVILDVVYNHTHHLDSSFQRTAPWYYYRVDEQGQPSNGSGCGCEVASERPMCAKFILDSVLYWAEEYHIDGFRFDLMGLLDVELMNRIQTALDRRFGAGEKLVYGEPWAAGPSAMEAGAIPASKENMGFLHPAIGMFCDDSRDAIKGHVFQADGPGFVTDAPGLEQNILNSAKAWCGVTPGIQAPSQVLTYLSAHDNLTLWDKLGVLVPEEQERLRRNRFAAAIAISCQGRLFLLSGEEAARTKQGCDNSYQASVELNRLDWSRAYAYASLFHYYQGLIALRKHCPGLCDKSPQASNRFLHCWTQPGAAGYFLDNQGGDSLWMTLCVIYNQRETDFPFLLPTGLWTVLADGQDSFLWQKEVHTANWLSVPPHSAMLLGR